MSHFVETAVAPSDLQPAGPHAVDATRRGSAASTASAGREVPDIVIRLGEERAYLFAEAVADGLFGLANLATRLVRAAPALLFRTPSGS